MREPDFDLSADMRLLELQRGALGLPPQERTNWESRTGAESSLPIPEREPEPGKTPVLAVEAVALPADGVIPGAVVTLSLSVANEGAALASDVVVAAPLPGGASYRPGSFVWNGRSTYDDVADSFFGKGLPVGGLAPGTRTSFQWKVGVRLGTKPLVIAPSVRAPSAAVVGARPVVIARKELSGTAFGAELQRADAAVFEAKPLIPVEIPAAELPELPIYELDEEEQLVYEAAAAALSDVAAPPVERQPEPSRAEPVEAHPQPCHAEPVEVQPEISASEPALETEPTPVREAVVLYGRFDRATLAFFERIFYGSKPPTVLQHCIFGGALSCTLDGAGTEEASLKKHLDAQSQVLHRIVLHEKLGKKEPIAEYAGELLAQLERLRPQPVGAPRTSKDSLLLVSELSEPTLGVLSRIAAERARWDFVKARQLTLALQAQNVADAGLDPALSEQIVATLHAYAQASVTALQKLFVRIRIDRTTGLLFQAEPSLDATAKAVIAAFKLALG